MASARARRAAVTPPPVAQVFTLANRRGMRATITNYGGIVMSLHVPDREGRLEDVVLGFDALEGYFAPHPFFGALIGRHANRIAKGRFRLDERDYVLATNDGPNHLHGGSRGFDKVVWGAELLAWDEGPALRLKHRSEDGDEGYPGTLTATVTYTITENDELRIDYLATTDRPTVVNLTQHSYFNLAGHGDILSHELFIDADRYAPVDAGLIPTGELRAVLGTPFDFREPRPIGDRVHDADPQLRFGSGYDHHFVLVPRDRGLRIAARVYEPRSGRIMEVLTTEPGLQLYAGNGLDGSLIGKKGTPIERYAGLCLETQHFPDSPNQPSFPSARLNPDEEYSSQTVYRFSTAP